MNQVTEKNYSFALQAAVISCVIVFSSFLWQGHKGFSLWDEGFLWYGVQRVLSGEVPIRDFMAYDPGRYYLSAALLSLFGDHGIMSLRAGVAIFQTFGLFVGLFLVARSQRSNQRGNKFFVVLAAITLAVWMFPRHKLFDISLSMLLIGVLTCLVESPSRKRFVLAGVSIGLAAVFGRNHGVYGALGSLAAIAWTSIKDHREPGFVRATAFWGAGVAIGFSPLIFMVLFIPGFGVSFWESIRFLFDLKATNLPLPVPWPWRVNFAGSSLSDVVRDLLIGVFFVALLIFGGVSATWVGVCKLRGRAVSPTLVASACLAFPYAHYAFSRADVGHLAHGIFPLLIGSFAALGSSSARIKWPLSAALCVASVWVMSVFHPGWQCRSGSNCVPVEVSGRTLLIDPGTAGDIQFLRELESRYAADGQPFLAVPFWPGAYALLEQRAPVWEIYPLFHRSGEFEQREIARIKDAKPGFVVVLDLPLDGREELRFKNTHPVLHRYIIDNFKLVAISPNPAYQTYKARNERE